MRGIDNEELAKFSLEYMLFFVLLLVFLAMELSLFCLIKIVSTRFQWVIMPDSKHPKVNHFILKNFLQNNYDSLLGWVPQPKSQGVDNTLIGKKEYHIDKFGRRLNTLFTESKSKVSVFGDSYSFGRLVNDDETWPYFLSCFLKTNIGNFSVGGYGLDQAYLRLKREADTVDSKLILMSVVPETMSRIHSYWKHYFEYGNTLAFKPKFQLASGDLVLHKPFLKREASFDCAGDDMGIKDIDYFYHTKFLKDMLTFPYFLSLFRTSKRNLPIIIEIIKGLLNRNFDNAKKKAFKMVLDNNASYTSDLYQNKEARNLFIKIIDQINELCLQVDKKVILVITPQLVDINRRNNKLNDYQNFFNSIGSKIDIVDLTDYFLSHDDVIDWYIEGDLGPHLSKYGNEKVAAYLFDYFMSSPHYSKLLSNSNEI